MKIALVVAGVWLASMQVAFAQAPVWRTSGELIKQRPASFTRLDRNGVTAVIARLPKELSLIRDYLLDKDAIVRLHKGDLAIDASFDNSDTLIVDGNLTIAGSYDDYGNGIGILVVLGDLRVDHVLSWGSLAVAGKLESSGLVYAYYNDFTFEVAGPIKARALVVWDKGGGYPDAAAAVVQSDDDDDATQSVRHFVPELMLEHVLDYEPEDDTLHAVPSYDVARKRVVAGQPIFRDVLAPESLASDVRKLFNPKLDAATRTRLAAADRLLAMVAATQEPLPAALQSQLLATGDAEVLELLAANPQASKATLTQIAQRSTRAAGAVARNPNAPAAAMAPMAASADPAVRTAMLERATLSATDLSRLAADPDGGVRKALVESRHVRQLTPAEIDKLVADPDGAVRAALPRRDGVLQPAQLTRLAADPSGDVRAAVAVALSGQAVWRQVPVGTRDEREALATKLLADRDEAVRFAALAAAAPAEQRRFVASMTGVKRGHVDAALAETTRDSTQMAAYAEGVALVAERLAENLALPPAVQLRLIERLQRPGTRLRPSPFDVSAIAKQSSETWDAVVEELVQNPNATSDALIAAATHCAQEPTAKTVSFCVTLLHRRDLPPAALDALGRANMEDWALTVLGSHYATRDQIARAAPMWHDDDRDVLAALARLPKGSDSEWFAAAATSKLVAVREIAAANAATPAAVLTRLLGDAENDVRGRAAANPSTPLDAVEKVAGLTSWVLANPRASDALVRRLLDRALADEDGIIADDCKEVLAARALRAVAP